MGLKTSEAMHRILEVQGLHRQSGPQMADESDRYDRALMTIDISTILVHHENIIEERDQ